MTDTLINFPRLQNTANLLFWLAEAPEDLQDSQGYTIAQHFDMSVWALPIHADICGTSACAVGFQTMLADSEIKLVCTPSALKRFQFQPSYNGTIGFDAVQEFYGIDGEASESLFTPDGYEPCNQRPDLMTVAEKIQRFIDSGGRIEEKVMDDEDGSVIGCGYTHCSECESA